MVRKENGKRFRAKKHFHKEKIPNVNVRLLLLFSFAARQSPQANKQVQAQQTNKALACSLEEENPTGPSATTAELYILLAHADYRIKELHLFTLFNKASKPQRKFFIETTARKAVELLSPRTAPIFSVNNVFWAGMVCIKQLAAHVDQLKLCACISWK